MNLYCIIEAETKKMCWFVTVVGLLELVVYDPVNIFQLILVCTEWIKPCFLISLYA